MNILKADIGKSGGWAIGFFLRRLADSSPQRLDTIGENVLHSQFERDRSSRTYVCSQLTLTDDRGTHAGKKGPLFYVDLAKSEEGKQGWGNPGNETVVRSVNNARVLVHRKITRTCFPRTVGQTRTVRDEGQVLKPERRACGYC